MSYTFPQFSLPYHAFPSYTFPYTETLNTSVAYTYSSGDVDYLSIPITGLPDYALPLSSVGGTYLKVYLHNTVISPQLYKAISDIYSSCYTQIKTSETDIADAASYIVSIDAIEAKVDLLKIFMQTKNVVVDPSHTTYLLSSVVTINNAVLNRSGMKDINDWLSENNIKVKTNWSLLCSGTGVTINSENIRD